MTLEMQNTLLVRIVIAVLICASGCPLVASWSFDSAYLNIRINDDATSEVHNEEQIVMNPKDTTNLVAVWRDFRLGYRQVGYGYSFDGGLTWQQGLFHEPQYDLDSDPGITVDTAGNFYAVTLSYYSTSQPNGLFVFKSTDGGASWGDPVPVINGVPGVFEDKELIACDRSEGPFTDNLYVAWTRFYSTQILLCRSTDGGESFLGPVTVSDIGGVQWPVPCVGSNSEVYVAWVQFTPDAIRFDRSTDGGQTFGSDITVQSVTFGSGDLYGGVRVYSFPAMDADITGGPFDGNIYIAYMDDAPGMTDTDIYFTRSTDGGTSWSEKVRINDDSPANGCDQFHPWLTVAPDGAIVVVFLDRRLDPGNLLMDLYMTTSTDGGATWSANERITTESSDPTAGTKSGGNPEDARGLRRRIGEPTITAEKAGLIGEYIGVTASSIDDIHPVWTDTRLGDQDVFVGVRRGEVQTVFLRADSNIDSTVNMADALHTMRYLYVPGSPIPPCLKAADTDDNGEVALSDAIYTLRYLYIPEAPAPPSPGPDSCGHDPTADDLSCTSHPCMDGRTSVVKPRETE